MSDHIPLEIQVEIIKTLTVKSIIRFRSVSKSWKSVIGSSNFITNYTVHNHPPLQHLLIRYDNLSSQNAYFSILDDVNFPHNNFPITVPRSINLIRDPIIVGTSHGLFCLFGYKSGMAMAVVWNPSIRKAVDVPVPDVYLNKETAFGFGVCRTTSDPKIVKISDRNVHWKMKGVDCRSSWYVEVYSLSSGVWRRSIHNLPANFVECIRVHTQVTIDGFVYWFGVGNLVSDTQQVIISFDLASEEFNEICLPLALAFHDPVELFFCKRRNSLAVLKERVAGMKYDLWVMEDSDSKWFTDHVTIDVPDMLCGPLECRRNGEVMMTVTEDTEGESEVLLVYEAFSEQIDDLGVKRPRYSFLVRSYTESLMLLDHTRFKNPRNLYSQDQMSERIPFDVQVEIVKKLSIKSLIRFRSVSKPWKSVIDSSDFIAEYTVHNHVQPQHLLIKYDNLSYEETYVSFVDDDAFPQNKVSLTVPLSVNLLCDSIVVGTSHGLICLFGYYRNFDNFEVRSGTAVVVFWNPLIRKAVAIDVPDVDWPEGTAFGFGVCPATSDPMIVKINDTSKHRKWKTKGVSCSSRWQVEVYSLSLGVWRSLSSNLSDELIDLNWPHSQVTIDGFIYWLGEGNAFDSDTAFYLIISFDLSREEFNEIYLPDELAFLDPMELLLFKRSDSLAVLQNWCDTYDVWIMENGDSRSFTKIVTINNPYYVSSPLEFRRHGELIIMVRMPDEMEDDTGDSEACVVYESLSEHFDDLGIKCRYYSSLLVSSYTESLLLLDQSDTLFDDEDDEEMSL